MMVQKLHIGSLFGRFFACALAGTVVVWGSGCGAERSEAPSYEEVTSTVEGGSGRMYMGREIADVMSSEHGSLWLDRPERGMEELPQRLFQVLDIGPSTVIADIGAGTGYFTFQLASMVPHGRVYAVEVQPSLVDTIRARAQRDGLKNVTAVAGTISDPALPPDRIDLALIVSSYHEFSHPLEMTRAILRSLKPLGRLAIVEYRAEDTTIPVPRAHRMSVEQITRELTAAGFRWRATLDVLPQQHVVIFEKPESGA